MSGRERVEHGWTTARTAAARGGHLVRRFAGSLSPRSPSTAEDAWAERQLLPSEVLLWRCMVNADRRHSITVARRFDTATGGGAGRAAVAGALLHDVGKVESGLGTFDRVLATVVGPRLSRGKYARYHQHEDMGADLCEAAGSEPLTVALVRGEGAPEELRAALRAADDV